MVFDKFDSSAYGTRKVGMAKSLSPFSFFFFCKTDKYRVIKRKEDALPMFTTHVKDNAHNKMCIYGTSVEVEVES